MKRGWCTKGLIRLTTTLPLWRFNYFISFTLVYNFEDCMCMCWICWVCWTIPCCHWVCCHRFPTDSNFADSALVSLRRFCRTVMLVYRPAKRGWWRSMRCYHDNQTRCSQGCISNEYRGLNLGALIYKGKRDNNIQNWKGTIGINARPILVSHVCLILSTVDLDMLLCLSNFFHLILSFFFFNLTHLS